MEPLYKSFKEYIDSGEYFADAKHWYKYKYIHPFSQRSFVLLLSFVICAIFMGIVVNIRGIFPVIKQVKYSISAETGAHKAAQIIRANSVSNNPIASITDVLCRNYVTQRECYDYDNLKKQFIYVKNNSTRIVFRRFYNSMSIDNPTSPVLKYQKNVKRKVEVLSSDLISDSKIRIKFRSIAKNLAGEIIENMVWLANIEYEIDQINNNLPSGSRFYFIVTDYQPKLLEDKIRK